MPNTLGSLLLLLDALIVSIVLSIILAFITSKTGWPGSSEPNSFRLHALSWFGITLPVALLGFVVGYLTGLSRTAAVGSTLPAVLTLIGGVNIFFVTSKKGNPVLMSYCVSLLVITLFYGVMRGASEREYGREDRLISLSEQEKRVRNYRGLRDLPSDMPDWVTTGEPR